MSPLFNVFLTLIAVAQASGDLCGDSGNTCYHINDPCPSGTEDCSAQYSCSLETNKCCCINATSCPQDWVAQGELCYHVIDTPFMVQSDAQQECQDLGAELPVIKSAEENDFILSLAKGLGEPWLGMHINDDDKFYWVDGTAVADTFSTWAENEPNHLSFEDCAYMYVAGDQIGKWNNIRCNVGQRLAICQKNS